MIPAPRRRGRFEMISNIVLKDLRGSWKTLLIALVIALIIMALVFNSVGRGRYCDPYSPCTFVWYWQAVAYVYAVAALITTLGVGLAFGSFYGGEIKAGTVRALILYPLDLNDLTLAKLLSASVVGSITSMIGFFLPIAPFAAYGYLEAGGVVLIYFAALFTTICILFAGAFLAHILTHFTGRLFLTPSVVAGLMMILAIISTQEVVNGIGSVMLVLKSAFGGAPVTYIDEQNLWNTAGGISVLSPHHATATVLTGILGPNAHFPDIYIVIPLGLALILGGYFLGRKIYLDVFIR